MSQATILERPYVNSNLFSSHYLDERIVERDEWDCDEVAQEAMDELQSLYDLEGDLVAGYGEDALIGNWIDEVLDILGFGTHEEVTLPDGGGFVDQLLFETPGARREAARASLDADGTELAFERGVGILEAKQWDADFTTRFSEQRPYRNASHQVKHYLESTPENIQWGILTNGRKWRLYGTKDYETQTYYEVDLPELLDRGELEPFKYFFVFFRPDAFLESAGTTFLDEVWSESETAAQELGEDLQDNVFTALRVLGRGFLESNDSFSIDPDDQEALDELKDQSLVLLYRLMFVLYAEARGLIHPEGHAAEAEYEENFSLDVLRLDIHDSIGELDEGFEGEFSEYSTTMWSRLEDLFRLIDQGEESLGIPPYNGGLFDQREHAFLEEHQVSNQYLAEVIYRLSTTQNGDGKYVLADYGDLDTRHIGSVYEGLLEHQFRIAPEQYAAIPDDGGQVWKPATEVTVADAVETVPQGGLFVVNDEGERKATGAYYTPDYVVTYIVEETIGPLVDEIREDLIDQGFEPGTQEYLGPYLRRISALRILDPAMGSGHFLTRATGYLAERVMAEVRDVETEMAVAFDEQHIRRQIAKECIYGVDLNGMAVELAKLSMWLETLAADRPLAFLDHHFKQGNSLVGSEIEAIEELESDSKGDEAQFSLADFGATREGTIERLMDVYSEFLAIENESVDDVREMKRRYDEIEQDKLRRRLVTLANVHTAERFDLDIPNGVYERMARALEDEEEWEEVQKTDWFGTAQNMADKRTFFHWKLSFPEAFYDLDGSELENPGFDVILGNPPWGVKFDETAKMYNKRVFRDIIDRMTDSFMYFMRNVVPILKDRGLNGFIIPSSFLTQSDYTKLRNYVLSNSAITNIVNLGDDVFGEDVDNPSCILIYSLFGVPQPNNQIQVSDVRHLSPPEKALIIERETEERIIQKVYENTHNQSFITKGINNEILINNLRDNFPPLGDYISDINRGISADLNEASIVNDATINKHNLEQEICKKVLTGDNVRRYSVDEPSTKILYLTRSDDINQYPKVKSYLKQFKSEITCSEVRDGKHPWYALHRPRTREIFDSPKIVGLTTTDHLEVGLDFSGSYAMDSLYLFKMEESQELNIRYLVSLLNSGPVNFIYRHFAQEEDRILPQVKAENLYPIPIPIPETKTDEKDQYEEYATIHNKFISQKNISPEEIIKKIEKRPDFSKYEYMAYLNKPMEKYHNNRSVVNLDLLDHLGNYSTNDMIIDIGTYQPPEGIGNSILNATKEDFPNLRVGGVTCNRENSGTVVICATARYKPGDEADLETDRWGYTETEPMPAMRLTDLSETEADLVEAFVPVAVENAGGFAGFRETATKTNSLVDRLEAITLPEPDDVAEDLQRYWHAVERANELDEKIEQTDDLIDEIVYELYRLTEEEIEIVEEAVR